jgi:hypothetical protein
MKLLINLSLLVLLLSCSGGDMKKYSKLEGLRVLGIIADNPEINAAATVSLTPYLSYPDGGDTTLEISYEACFDPGIGYGAKVSCDSYSSSQVIRDPGNLTYNTASIGAANFYTGPMTAIALPIPAAAFTLLATQSSERQFNGVDFIFILKLTDSNKPENTITTVKRISLTTKSSGLNQNPTAGNIQNNNGDVLSFPSSKVNLKLATPSAAETYQLNTPDGLTSLTESMLISWFSNRGEFKFSRTGANESVEFDPKGATSGVLVAVYRDNRGGLVIKRFVAP